jgi:hypothetical protein
MLRYIIFQIEGYFFMLKFQRGMDNRMGMDVYKIPQPVPVDISFEC